MTIRSNGSYIGSRPTGPSSSVASGIWDLRTVERQMRATAWPVSLGSPTEITGLAVWLDASSADTLYDATSGGSLVAADNGVARWEDKSGNGSHAVQGTGANQPLRKASVQNGRDVLRFDGTNDTLQISSITLPTYFTAFVVSSTTRSGSDLKFWMEHSANVNSNDGFFFNGTYEGAWTIRRGAGSSAVRYGPIVDSSDWIGSGWALASLTYNSEGVGAIYKNGTFVSDSTLDLSTTAPATSALSNSDVTASLNIASRNGSGLFLNGDIGEIVIYNSALSSVSREAVENYLLAKWGIG